LQGGNRDKNPEKPAAVEKSKQVLRVWLELKTIVI
jgi:hypothetical protein